MADTARNRADLIALFADNVTGQLSEQDLRDFLVTVMPAEFLYSYDQWVEPDAAQVTTDLTVRGWIQHSQTMHADCSASFGMPLCLTSNGLWAPANVTDSTRNTGVFGIPADSYASGATSCEILRRGVVYHSALAARFAGYRAMAVYLQSAASTQDNNSASIDCQSATNVSTPYSRFLQLGYVLDSDTGKWFFNPPANWPVVGT